MSVTMYNYIKKYEYEYKNGYKYCFTYNNDSG